MITLLLVREEYGLHGFAPVLFRCDLLMQMLSQSNLPGNGSDFRRLPRFISYHSVVFSNVFFVPFVLLQAEFAAGAWVRTDS